MSANFRSLSHSHTVYDTVSENFDIVPLLYGAVGLEYVTGEELQPDDIDIIIPGSFIGERWQEFKPFSSLSDIAQSLNSTLY